MLDFRLEDQKQWYHKQWSHLLREPLGSTNTLFFFASRSSAQCNPQKCINHRKAAWLALNFLVAQDAEQLLEDKAWWPGEFWWGSSTEFFFSGSVAEVPLRGVWNLFEQPEIRGHGADALWEGGIQQV